ncbi:MAG: DUF3021 family protein [Lachnospiraceae bacterium]|nr:DUF3021 family protein [Lachnospiraceae bacterium]
MWEKIKEMLYTFSYVTTGVVFATAFFLTVFKPDTYVSINLLWQILGISLVCVFGNLLYPVNKELSKKQMCIRMILHYLYINLIVLECGYYFDWFFIGNLKMVFCMIVLIAIIFVVVSFVMWNNGRKTSRQLNEQLKEYQKKDL